MSLEIKKRLEFLGHTGAIYGLAFDPIEQQIISAGGDGWIVQWSLANKTDGTLLAKIDDKIFSLLYVPEYQLFLAGTQSGDLYFVPRNRKRSPRRFAYHQKGVFDIKVWNGLVLTAGGDGKLGIWDIKKEQLTESIRITNSKLRSIAKSSLDQVMAIGASDQNIYLLNALDFRLLHTIEDAHHPSVFTVQFSPDGVSMISGGRDAQIKIWQINHKYRLESQFSAHWFTINHLCYNTSGTRLFSASRDKTVRIWDTNSWKLLKEINLQKNAGHVNSVNRLLWLDNPELLISASDDRKIMVWET